jgi:predicted dehydrogenase
VPDRAEQDNGFKVQWEKFLRHVAFDEPFPWDFLEAAKGIQLAELGIQSWEQRRFVEVPELAL